MLFYISKGKSMSTILPPHKMLLLLIFFCSMVAVSLGDENAQKFVEDVIQSRKVVVFSKTYCVFSKRAKSILGAHRIGKADILVVELDLEIQDVMNDIQNYLLQKTGGRTVPRIFIHGNFVGGADDLQKLNQTGELKLLLSKAGVLQQDL